MELIHQFFAHYNNLSLIFQIMILLTLILPTTLIILKYLLTSKSSSIDNSVNKLQNDYDKVFSELESLKLKIKVSISDTPTQTDQIETKTKKTQTDVCSQSKENEVKDSLVDQKKVNMFGTYQNILNLLENLGEVKNVIFSDSLTDDDDKIYLLKKHAESFLNFEEMETRLNLAELKAQVAESNFGRVFSENILLKEKISELANKIDDLKGENKKLAFCNLKLTEENKILENKKIGANFPANFPPSNYSTVDSELEIRCRNYLVELKRSEMRNAQLQQCIVVPVESDGELS